MLDCWDTDDNGVLSMAEIEVMVASQQASVQCPTWGDPIIGANNMGLINRWVNGGNNSTLKRIYAAPHGAQVANN